MGQNTGYQVPELEKLLHGMYHRGKQFWISCTCMRNSPLYVAPKCDEVLVILFLQRMKSWISCINIGKKFCISYIHMGIRPAYHVSSWEALLDIMFLHEK